jgi:molecular chaperone GrpE
LKPKTPKKPDLSWDHPKNIARNIGKLWRNMPEQEVEIPETNANPADAASGQTASAQSEAVETVSRAEFEQAKAELAKLGSERDQLVDRLARLQAEFENARKRAEREKAEFRDFATGSVVENFLPVIDNFELALQAARQATGSADQLRSGVELIVKQMDEVLRQLQVTAIPTVGEPFDPRFHEALGSVERDDLPDHTVAEEIRRGYKIRDRLLRPAMVRVASNPKQVAE